MVDKEKEKGLMPDSSVRHRKAIRSLGNYDCANDPMGNQCQCKRRYAMVPILTQRLKRMTMLSTILVDAFDSFFGGNQVLLSTSIKPNILVCSLPILIFPSKG